MRLFKKKEEVVSPKIREIDYIVVHCTAGHANAEAVQNYFTRPVKAGGRGWKTGGYHVIIEKDGTAKQMYDFDVVTNGVKGFNSNAIHISYVGGVNPNNVNKAQDTRTEAQKHSLEKEIMRAQLWLSTNGRDMTRPLTVLGHRDFSKDKDGSGVIEEWERIKACPSFNAIDEYRHLSIGPINLPNP